MYAIYAYIRVAWGVNVGIYGIHGESGFKLQMCRQAWTLRPSGCPGWTTPHIPTL